MVDMWDKFGVYFQEANRVIDNLQWAEIAAIGDRVTELRRGDTFASPGRAVLWIDPDNGISVGQHIFNSPNLFTMIECAPVSYANMYKCSISVKDRSGGVSGCFSVMFKLTNFIDLDVDQLYVSFGNPGFGGDTYSYDVFALGRKFNIDKDKHPEWFHDNEGLTYAMLTGEAVVARLPETVKQLENLVLLAYTVSRLDDKSILDRLAKMSYYKNKA